jgi:EmrB/QacA subfamily drug resistance transporter
MRSLRSIVVACVGAFVSALSTSLVAVAAPVMAHELHTTQAGIGWVLTAYLLAVSSLLATSGRLADVLGRKRVYLAGFGIFTVASIACGTAPTLRLLVGARVVQGVGASMLMATGPAIITRAFPPEKRARALGVQLAVTYAGLTLGPTLGGILTSALSWHAVFFAVAGAAVLGTVVTAALLETDEPVTPTPRLDVVGGVLLAIGLAALLTSLRRGGSLLAIPVAVVALAAFVRQEAKHPAPVLPLGLLGSPAFGLGIVSAMLLYVVTFVLAYLLPFQLQGARAMTPAHAGALVTSQPATMAIVAPVSGWLADRFGARWPSVMGFVVIAVGMALVAGAASGPDVSIIASLAVVGVGAGLFVAPNNAVIMAAAPKERQGTAAAMAATARTVGMASGVALAVALHEIVGFHAALLVAAGLALAGAILGVVRPIVLA